MPISIVVGGQFGSEGKGKVAHYVARADGARAVVRVGGPNSGHTVYADDGKKYIFQHLPTAAVLPEVLCILAAGSYIDLSRLAIEVKLCKLSSRRLKIDPNAVVITEQDSLDEHLVGLRAGIGSTLTGTGAAVLNRISRTRPITFAKDMPELSEYLTDTKELFDKLLSRGDRVVIEGTQGFGLSVLHTSHYPYATSRDTTAAGFLSECGASPLSVDDVTLVIRAFPIRVPGNSGPLPYETSWQELSTLSGGCIPEEMTSVTKAVRRVAKFDPEIVRQAIRSNQPTRIFLNHLDYFDKAPSVALAPSRRQLDALDAIETSIGRSVDFIGLSGTSCLDRRAFFECRAQA